LKVRNKRIIRLFSKFATKSSKGTGLGLFICKNIVEVHSGKMWSENNNNDDRKKELHLDLAYQ
jgi:signal transduction histidine kinase